MLLVVLLAIALSWQVARIDRPFRGNLEGLQTGVPLEGARSFARYGFAASRGAAVVNAGRIDRASNRVLYANHPTGVLVVVAGALQLFGDNEWASRLVPALCALGCMILLAILAWPALGPTAALVAAGAFAFAPISLVFADQVEYIGSPLLLCALATIACWLRWRATAAPAWLAATVGCFILAALCDWPAFYLAPLLALHTLIAQRLNRRAWIEATMIGLLSTALFVLLVLWANWAAGASILSRVAARSSAFDDADQAITLARWLQWGIGHQYGLMHTWPLLILGLTGTALALLPRTRQTLGASAASPSVAPLLLVAGWGALHLAIGWQGNYQHEFWNLIVTPALALGAGAAVSWILNATLRARAMAAAPLVIVVLIAAFALTSRSIAATYSDEEYGWSADYPRPYAMRELGRVIRATASPTEGVLTAYQEGPQAGWAHPALLWYADRQLRVAIDTPEKLNAALGAGPYPLFFEQEQPDGPAPTWFVLHNSERSQYPQLSRELDTRFGPAVQHGEFVAYRLDRDQR